MAKKKDSISILIDTNALFPAGELFDHPDFKKLLRYSKTGQINIYISKISWEERRTQILEKVKTNASTLRSTLQKLSQQHSYKIVLQGLPEPKLALWTDEQIEKNSRNAMEQFAQENNITVLPYANDHSERAWKRFFSVDLPFNAEDPERENRRKDLPDAWILEAAVDLLAKEKEVVAIGKDGRLTKALKDIGCKIYPRYQDIIDLVEEAQEVTDVDARAIQAEIDVPIEDAEKIHKLLSEAKENIKDIEIKVLGFITFLDQPTKEQLYSILDKKGITRLVAENIAGGLVIANLVKDTGDYYIANDSEVSQLAAKSVEDEIIELMSES